MAMESNGELPPLPAMGQVEADLMQSLAKALDDPNFPADANGASQYMEWLQTAVPFDPAQLSDGKIPLWLCSMRLDVSVGWRPATPCSIQRKAEAYLKDRVGLCT